MNISVHISAATLCNSCSATETTSLMMIVYNKCLSGLTGGNISFSIAKDCEKASSAASSCDNAT